MAVDHPMDMEPPSTRSVEVAREVARDLYRAGSGKVDAKKVGQRLMELLDDVREQVGRSRASISGWRAAYSELDAEAKRLRAENDALRAASSLKAKGGER